MLPRVNSRGCPVGAMSTSPTRRWIGVFENAHAPQNIFPLVVHVGTPLPLIQNDKSFLNGRVCLQAGRLGERPMSSPAISMGFRDAMRYWCLAEMAELLACSQLNWFHRHIQSLKHPNARLFEVKRQRGPAEGKSGLAD
jgi:hypothetical protein